MSLGAPLWRATTCVLAPALPLYLRWRAGRGKELPGRVSERSGHGADRPAGRLLWLHAASVGETVSALPLIEALLAADAALELLVTTGTVTSARLLEQRLPPALAPRIRHRFVPLDVPRWVGRFLDGWRPDAAVILESELWPTLIFAVQTRGIPLALVNGRMSERSLRGWRRAPALAREILGAFRLVLAQSEADRGRFAALGAAGAQCWGNLKYAAPPLPADVAELARLRTLLTGRHILLAASTHPGEDPIVAAAHERLLPRFHRLLTIIVPRHPERGEAIARDLARLMPTRRAAGEDPGPEAGLHIADTLGELGLFYRLADLAFIGGSLVEHGGQNPLEPARLNCPILLGPHTWNFEEPVARLLAAGGALRIEPGADPAGALAEAAASVLSNPERGKAMAGSAAAIAAGEAALPSRIAAALLPLLAGQDMNEGRVTVDA